MKFAKPPVFSSSSSISNAPEKANLSIEVELVCVAGVVELVSVNSAVLFSAIDVELSIAKDNPVISVPAKPKGFVHAEPSLIVAE